MGGPSSVAATVPRNPWRLPRKDWIEVVQRCVTPRAVAILPLRWRLRVELWDARYFAPIVRRLTLMGFMDSRRYRRRFVTLESGTRRSATEESGSVLLSLRDNSDSLLRDLAIYLWPVVDDAPGLTDCHPFDAARSYDGDRGSHPHPVFDLLTKIIY